MMGDDTSLSEKDIQDSLRKNVMVLWNVYNFYAMYATESKVESLNVESDNVLDKWILARLNELIKTVTENMEKYHLPAASRPISEFIDDLSTWYLRRSRDRFKGDDEKDKESAIATTGFVLLQLSKVMAPFMPFIAEQLWQKITGNDFKDENKSVHLESWPTTHNMKHATHNIIEEMEVARKIVELGLAERDKAGIKVRQPLPELRITNYELQDEYVALVKDEVNVKEITCKKGDGNIEVELDTDISDKLKLEGIKRDLVRSINNLRKDAGLTIQDKAVVYWESDDQMIKDVFSKMANEIMRDTLSTKINEGMVGDVDIQKEVKVNDTKLILGVKKQ